MMRRALSITLGASLALHAAAGFGVARNRAPTPIDAPDPAPALAGDTFELPAPEPDAPPPAPVSGPAPAPAPTSEAEAHAAEPEPGPAPTSRPTPPIPHAARPSTASSESAGATAATSEPAMFGAVGDRASVELAVAFTRAFPQAASGDPAWEHVAMGDSGEARVTLEIDEGGSLVGSGLIAGGSPALRAAIERTLVLVRGRSFVAKGRVTELRVRGKVSPDEVHDGLHGDVFAIGGSFTGREGSAFFALRSGRRVDVLVREVER